MRQWSLQEAKARFSELVNATTRDGPQLVTKRGVDAVVVVPAAEWRRMSARSPRTFKELLLAAEPRFDRVPATRRIGTKLRKVTFE